MSPESLTTVKELIGPLLHVRGAAICCSPDERERFHETMARFQADNARFFSFTFYRSFHVECTLSLRLDTVNDTVRATLSLNWPGTSFTVSQARAALALKHEVLELAELLATILTHNKITVD